MTVRTTAARPTASDTVTRTFTVTVTPVNDAPTLDPIANPATIIEDAGHADGQPRPASRRPGNESQTLTVTATSSNPGLIPNPTVTYTSPNATGTLTYTPAANQRHGHHHRHGHRTTAARPTAASTRRPRTFTVTVTAVNDAPTLDPITDTTVNEDAAPADGQPRGHRPGAANESQTLTVTATSSNTGPDPQPDGHLHQPERHRLAHLHAGRQPAGRPPSR